MPKLREGDAVVRNGLMDGAVLVAGRFGVADQDDELVHKLVGAKGRMNMDGPVVSPWL